MSASSVNVVTAFGRGEILCRDLANLGFKVRILDCTTALAGQNWPGAGPFPVALGQTKGSGARLLPRGLAIWTKAGPLELRGPMAPFFRGKPEVRALSAGKADADFSRDWLRRLLGVWASPDHRESWEARAGENPFPHDEDLYETVPGAFPDKQNIFSASDTRIECGHFRSLHLVSGRLTEVIAEVGQAPVVFAADQWVWCLSGRETAALNPAFAAELFPAGILQPDWNWLAFKVRAGHGPWMEGIPAHVLVVGDIFLPYGHANLVVLRREEEDRFCAWVKAPASATHSEAERQSLGAAVEQTLNARFELAHWTVDANKWGVCPHAPIFARNERAGRDPNWRNWSWIAPETLPRLDFGARLRSEEECAQRLVRWREESLKKRGALAEGATA